MTREGSSIGKCDLYPALSRSFPLYLTDSALLRALKKLSFRFKRPKLKSPDSSPCYQIKPDSSSVGLEFRPGRKTASEKRVAAPRNAGIPIPSAYKEPVPKPKAESNRERKSRRDCGSDKVKFHTIIDLCTFTYKLL
jgi:hypothetical protein